VLATTRPGRRSCNGEFKRSFRRTRCILSFRTYDTTTRRPIFVPASTPSSRICSINEHIGKCVCRRPGALERPDSIIVATWSAIYGLGRPQPLSSMVLRHVGATGWKAQVVRRLADIRPHRNEIALQQPLPGLAMVSTSFRLHLNAKSVRTNCSTTSPDTLSFFDLSPATCCARCRASRVPSRRTT